MWWIAMNLSGKRFSLSIFGKFVSSRSTRPRSLSYLIIGLCLLALSFFGLKGYCYGEYVKITSNNHDDFHQDIDKGQVVWEGLDGNDYEIYYWDGSKVIQVTNNDYFDRFPQIHNGQVVWQGYDGRDTEIFLWDGWSIRQLTDNDHNDKYPRIHDGQVVWQGWDGHDWEIFYWDGRHMRQITDNSYDDVNPHIHKGKVVWEGRDKQDYEIFLWDGVSVRALTQNEYDDRNPKINNGQVVWEGLDGEHWKIFFWDNSLRALTSGRTDDRSPSIHNGMVVWEHKDWYGDDFEIYLWDGESTKGLTHNDYDDRNPQIHEGHVVWERRRSGFNNYDIFFWDGTKAIDTRQYGSNPLIDNDQLVWTIYDGKDYEIGYWDGSQIIMEQLTDNNIDDLSPQIYKGRIVWRAGRFEDAEIYYRDNRGVFRLTDDDCEDYGPQISRFGHVVWGKICPTDPHYIYYIDVTGVPYLHPLPVDPGTQVAHNPQVDDNGLVVWWGWERDDPEGWNDPDIFVWDGDYTWRLRNKGHKDMHVQIDDGLVAWEGSGHIFLWDYWGNFEIEEIPFGSGFLPQVDNPMVVWEDFNGEHWQIFLWDNVKKELKRISPTGDFPFWEGDHRYPQIHNGQVVWQVKFENQEDYEIFYWDESQHFSVTYNDFDDINPKIHDGIIVWEANEDIFFMFCSEDPPGIGWYPINLTDDGDLYEDRDPQIFGSQIVWSRYDGSDYEIWRACVNDPDLAVHSFQMRNVVARSIPVNYKLVIRNRGEAPEAHFWAKIYKDLPSPPEYDTPGDVGISWQTSLAPHSGVSSTGTLRFDTDGPHDVYIRVSCFDEEECNVKNNIFGPYRVYVGPDVDFDANGNVDGLDLARFATCYGSNADDPHYETSCDLVLDQQIDVQDLGRFAEMFGESNCPCIIR